MTDTYSRHLCDDRHEGLSRDQARQDAVATRTDQQIDAMDSRLRAMEARIYAIATIAVFLSSLLAAFIVSRF